jgi:hypothetical protein
LEVRGQQHGNKAHTRERAGHDQQQTIHALHGFEFARALGRHSLFHELQSRGHGLRVACREGFGFLAIAFQRQLRGAKLLLKLKIRPQRLGAGRVLAPGVRGCWSIRFFGLQPGE